MNDKKTFIKVTNGDIYTEIKALRTDLQGFRTQNNHEHGEIIGKHQKNKAEIDITKWIAGSALGISVFISALMITGSL